jgi:DNA-binding CsgD family transcriptional regulator/type II secretory pathway predicted ATPase ExeA
MESRSDPVRCPLLIGRDDLLDLADRRLGDVEAGRGQLLVVAGEAGIGKTRFLDAIWQKATERGFVCVGGYVAPQDHDVPAASILDMARSMLRHPNLADLGRELLTLGDHVIDADYVRRRRQLVMDVVDQILAALPDKTLLLFEDLQWTDDLSLEIVAELARRSRDRTVMLCGGYRTDETLDVNLRDWRSRLLTQRIAEEVRLTPLTQAETALVTTLILDTGLPAPREVAAAVYERTDGIPLHIEELLGALSAEARANGLAIREATVPDTIEDAVLARLRHRSPEAQQVARAGAIVGRCFVPEVLAGIMDVPPEALDAPIQELIDNYVLEAPGSRGLYDFRHQLLRDAIYRSVPVGDRRRYHARAGEFGAQLEGHSEIHSSLHFERAGLRRRAFETALSGARDASRMSAHRESTELYRRAVDNMPVDRDPAERAAILDEAATEAANVEDHEMAISMATAAADAHRAAGDPVAAINSTLLVINIDRRECGSTSERLARLRALEHELEPLPESDASKMARADVALYIGISETDRHDFAAARAAFALARRLGDEVGDPEFAMMADWKEGVLDVIAGDVAGGVRRISDIAVDAERAGREATGVSSYRDAALMAATGMVYPEARQWLSRGVRYADSIEQSHCAHVMRATSALTYWAEGDWDTAAAEAGQAMADRGCRRASEFSRHALGFEAMGRGELAKAESILEPALALGEHSETVELTLPPLWGMAEVALQAGDPARAFALAQDALQRSTAVSERLLFLPFVVTGVRAAQAAGRPLEAASFLSAAEALLAPIADLAAPALDHGRGLVALADGSTGIAREALERAVAGWDGKGRIWEATWARLDLANCMTRTNRFADALSLAVEARTVASRLDSRALADRADAIQRMARGRVSVEEPWRPLTAREFAVARLVSEGYTNAEIADSLGIAPKTASSHVEHILAKLGASRRAEIASWASAVQRSPLPN